MTAIPGPVGTITVPGSTGQVTYTLPAGSGTVKALLVWWTEQTAAGTADHARFGMGFGTYRGGVVSQYFHATSMVDAGTTEVGASENGTGALCVIHDEGTSTRDGEVDLISMGDAQFVLDWVNLPATASTLLSYMALCGTDFTDALVGTVTIANATGAQDVTVVTGFGQPDLLMFISAGTQAADATDPTGAQDLLIGVCFGAAIKDGAARASSLAADDGAGTMEVGVWQQAGVVLSQDDNNIGTELGETSIGASSGWPTDGFEFNRVNAAAQTVGYLALKGTFNKAMSARATRTSTGDDDYDVGFSNQKAALVWGVNVIGSAGATAPDTTNAQLGQFFMGACDYLGNEAYKGFSEEDNAGNADTYSYHSGTKTLQMHNADDGTVLLEADGSFSGNNFRLNYNDIDATSREYNALVVGWTIAGGVIKTYEGLAKASTKTVVGLAQASVKTWVGVANT